MDAERPGPSRLRWVIWGLVAALTLTAAREVAFRRNRLRFGPPEARRRPPP